MFQHGDLVADVLDDGEVMGDEEVGEAELLLQIHEKIDDLGLDGNVEGADRLVANDEFRFDGEGAGDADALALAAAKLVRETAGVGGVEADQLEKFGHAGRAVGRGYFREMDLQRLRKDGANAKAGIEGVIRVLKDHLDLFAVGAETGAVKGGDLLAVVGGGAGGGVLQTDEDPAEGGLAGTAFADEAEGGALVDFKGDVVECLDHTGLALK